MSSSGSTHSGQSRRDGGKGGSQERLNAANQVNAGFNMNIHHGSAVMPPLLTSAAATGLGSLGQSSALDGARHGSSEQGSSGFAQAAHSGQAFDGLAGQLDGVSTGGGSALLARNPSLPPLGTGVLPHFKGEIAPSLIGLGSAGGSSSAQSQGLTSGVQALADIASQGAGGAIGGGGFDNHAAIPTDIITSNGVILENLAGGSVVATLSAIDADAGESFTYAIAFDSSGLFEIVDDKLVLKHGAQIDFESQNAYDIVVRVTDGGGNSYKQTLHFTVQDVVGETLSGSNNADTIRANLGNDSIAGGGGDDRIETGVGNDTLMGGAGNDTIIAGGGDDTVSGGLGVDRLVLSGQRTDYSITQNADGSFSVIDLRNPSLDGVIQASLIEEFAFSDGLHGVGAILPVELTALADNYISSSAGGDIIYALDGSDSIAAGVGNDFIDGGLGLDTAVFVAAVSVDLAAGTAIGEGNDTLVSIENVTTGSGNDSVKGSAGDNVIAVGLGNNTVDAGAGNDVIIAGGGHDTIDGGADFDRLTLTGNRSDYSIIESPTGTFIITDLRAAPNDGVMTVTNVEAFGFADGTVPQNDLVTDGFFTSGLDTFSRAGVNYALVVNDSTAGGDAITTGAKNDQVNAGSGNDTVNGGAGADTMSGGAGIDTLDYSTSNAGVSVNLTTSAVSGGDASGDVVSNFENVTGSAFADSITGHSANNAIDGGAGIDIVTFTGALSDYTITEVGGVYTIVGLDGTDILTNIEQVKFTDGTYNLVALTSGHDTAAGTSGNDLIFAGNGNDTLTSSVGNDSYNGGAGVDRLNFTSAVSVNLATGVASGEGNDTLTSIENLNMGGGDDSITGSFADNIIDGGAGTDTMTFTGNRGDYTIALNADGSYSVTDLRGLDGTDTLYNIESLVFADGAVSLFTLTLGVDTYTATAGDDVVYALAGNDTLRGGLGNDFIDGGGDNDTIDYAGMTTAMTVNITTGLATGEGNDTLVSIENVVTGAGNDLITGTLGNNAINGGVGNDTVVYTGALSDYTIRFAAGVYTIVGPDGTDTLTNIENLTFSNGTFSLNQLTTAADVFAHGADVGNMLVLGAQGGNDSIVTGSGNDSVIAGSGNDTISGGLGNDTLDGGAGIDLLDFSGKATGVTVDLSTSVSSGEGTDRIIGFENVMGGSGADSITGNSLDNVIEGGLGADTLDGGAGVDIVSYAGYGSGILVNLLNGTATGGDVLSNFENITGSGFNDTLTGSSGDNAIDGGAGNDTVIFTGNRTDYAITLAGGVYTISSLDGIDTYINIENFQFADGIVSAAQLMPMVLTTGNDTWVSVSSGGDIVDGLSGNDSMSGGVGNDSLFGNSGNDTLLGGSGNDELDGGNDNDTAKFASTVNVNLATSIATGEGTDTLMSIENVVGSNGNDTIIGDALDNILEGAGGNDLIEGGDGDDIAVFNNSFNNYDISYNSVAGSWSVENVLGSPNDGIDTISGVELFQFANRTYEMHNLNAGADIFDHASDTAHLFVDGRQTGNDIVKTGSGDDVVYGSTDNDTVFSSLGNDNLNGWTGSNTLTYENSATAITANINTGVASGEGTDKISGFMTIVGSAFDDSITGNGSANNLKGGEGLDTLFGDFGDDTLEGGAGNDSLDGGTSNDTAVFLCNFADYSISYAAGVYTVTDLRAGSPDGTDMLTNFETLQFADGKWALNSLTASADSFAHGADTLNLYVEGSLGDNDSITTGSGTDYVVAGGGNDVIALGAGNDTLDGGAGADFLVLSGDIADYEVTYDTMTGYYTLEDLRVGAPDGIDLVKNVENISFNNGTVAVTSFLPVNLTPLIDTYIGGILAENIDALAGNDTIDGGGGNDTITGGVGADNLNGGTGVNTLSYSGSVAGVSVNLGINAATGGDATGDVIVNFQNLVGSNSGNDTLFGSADDNRIAGGGGIDTVDFSSISSNVTVNLATSMASGQGNDTLTGFERVVGSNLADLIVGDGFANSLSGGGGNDTLNGGAGNDSLVGGAGTDTAVFTGETSDYSFAFDGTHYTLTDLRSGSPYGVDILNTIEIAQFSNGTFELKGLTTGVDTYTGTSTNELILGLAGNDTFNGGLGNDIIYGGVGIDTANYSSLTTAMTVNLATSLASGQGDDKLIGIENVTTGSGNDSLTGDGNANILNGGAGINTLNGGAGNDSLIGGTGTDTVVFTGATSDYTVTYDGTNYTFTDNRAGSPDGTDMLNMIEIGQFTNGTFELKGLTAGVDSYVGTTANEFIIALGGNDTILGSSGVDVVDGGTGTDALDYSAYLTSVTLNLVSGDGNDTVVNVENITGGGAGDSLLGDNNANTILGREGNDSIDGGAGNDYIAGGRNLIINGSFEMNVVTPGTTAILNETLVAGWDNNGATASIDIKAGAFGKTPTDGLNYADIDSTGSVDTLFQDVKTVAGQAYTLTFDIISDDVASDTLEVYWNGALAGIYDPTSTTSWSSISLNVTGTGGLDRLEFKEQAAQNNSFGTFIDNVKLIDINNDTLIGGAGNDTIDGFAGNDFITGGANNDSIIGGLGIDTAVYSGASSDYSIEYNLNTRQYVVSDLRAGSPDGTDTLDGMEMGRFSNGTFDLMTKATPMFTPQADLWRGSSSAENFVALASNDTVDGADGNDTIQGGAGADSLEGGAGFDMLSYATSTVAVNINLTTGVLFGGDAALDTISGFEGVIGSNYNDTVFGSHYADSVMGGDGNDSFNGSHGADTFMAGNGTDIFDDDGHDNKGDYADMGAGNDTIWAGYGDDTILGGANNDVLYGEDGNDSLSGNAGNDLIDGSVGNDMASYATSLSAVTVNLTTGLATGEGNDTLSSIEQVWGSSFADSITGSANADTLIGGLGNDTLIGNAGADIFSYSKGDGNDLVSGGVGNNDALQINNAVYGVDFSVTLTSGTMTFNGTELLFSADADGAVNFTNGQSIQFIDIEKIEGLPLTQNVLLGTATAQAHVGGNGVDTLNYATSTAVNVNLNTNVVSGGFATGDTISGIENVTGGNGNDIFYDNYLSNVMTGNDGADFFYMYFGGADTVIGGNGNDFAEDNGTNNDGDYFDMGVGLDTVYGGWGNDTILLGTDNDLANGEQDDDYVDGGFGTDILFGNLGNDTLNGGNDNDTLYGEGQNDSLLGGAGADYLYGGGEDDILKGEADNDFLYGELGNDTLVGGSHNDYMDGGLGIDEVDYSATLTAVTVNITTGVATGDGTDTLVNIENITGSNFNDSLMGSTLSNELTGGLGHDTLNGGDGADMFIYTMGDGNDTIYGDGAAGTSNWTDKLAINGQEYGVDWSIALNAGATFEQVGSMLNLSPGADGTITFNDGYSIVFNDLEQINWSA